jgi:hypothetical protein
MKYISELARGKPLVFLYLENNTGILKLFLGQKEALTSILYNIHWILMYSEFVELTLWTILSQQIQVQ